LHFRLAFDPRSLKQLLFSCWSVAASVDVELSVTEVLLTLCYSFAVGRKLCNSFAEVVAEVEAFAKVVTFGHKIKLDQQLDST
jgi:hypothetical protein